MVLGLGKTHIPYGMFDVERSADEARRFAKCERIYHRGQEIAWDGKEILPMLIEKHGGIDVEDDKKEALKRIFSIILWGELAAWRIAAQLADRLEPLEAKMAATSQAHDEARHFYVMYDYLCKLGYVPERLDRAPQAILDIVVGTDNLAYKLVGMQLLVEPMALTVFQTVREIAVEPVLTELMRYFERDEARHVGLGMQYLPVLMKDWNRRQISAMVTFQVRLMFWALWEQKILENDLVVLGIDPRKSLDRARKKQLAVLQTAFEAIGLPLDRERNYATMTMNAVIEFLFPADGVKAGLRGKLESVWNAFWRRPDRIDVTELDVHFSHAIKTARGEIARAERISA
ncbi:MAG: ferritin-like domain-containing protein [Proteobacteria bacterium]|nr:ferritin-like domain-containing protein [Pseudomonadota bacterium]